MVWYYVEAGKQAGPVDENQFQELVRAGRILADTLVWREGMSNWQPYGQVVAGGAGGPPPQPVAPAPASLVALPAGPAGMIYGGFWIRFLAKFLDGLILGVVLGLPIVLVLFATIMAHGPRRDSAPNLVFIGLQLILQLVYGAGVVAYNGIFLGKFGATPGKMALGLKVVTPEGASLSYGRAFGRSLAEILSGLTCDIGYIIAAFDVQKRTLHDHIASTRVIQTR